MVRKLNWDDGKVFYLNVRYAQLPNRSSFAIHRPKAYKLTFSQRLYFTFQWWSNRNHRLRYPQKHWWNQVFSVVKNDPSHQKTLVFELYRCWPGGGDRGLQWRKEVLFFFKQLHILTNNPNKSPFPRANSKNTQSITEHYRSLLWRKSWLSCFYVWEMVIIQVSLL